MSSSSNPIVLAFSGDPELADVSATPGLGVMRLRFDLPTVPSPEASGP